MEGSRLRTDFQRQQLPGLCPAYRPLLQGGFQSCPRHLPAHLTGVLASKTPATLLDTSSVAGVTRQPH